MQPRSCPESTRGCPEEAVWCESVLDSARSGKVLLGTRRECRGRRGRREVQGTIAY